METRAPQVPSGGLGIQCRASLPLPSKLLPRVSGFGGFATPPHQKKDPLFGGEKMFCGTGQNTPAKPAKAAVANNKHHIS
jgi:hypothetical protein